MDARTISVFGLEDSEDLGIFRKGRDWEYGREDVEVNVLKERIKEFLQDMQDIIDSVPEHRGGFHLDAIEINAEVSVKGRICLLGTGGELGGGGGIKFVLKRS